MAKIVTEQPLDLNLLLSMACSNPDDFRAWEAFNQTNQERREQGLDELQYEGWNRYDIQVHCVGFIIVARQLGDGQYEVREILMQDH